MPDDYLSMLQCNTQQLLISNHGGLSEDRSYLNPSRASCNATWYEGRSPPDHQCAWQELGREHGDIAGEESRGQPGGCGGLRMRPPWIQGNERIAAELRMRGEPAGLERLEGMGLGGDPESARPAGLRESV